MVLLPQDFTDGTMTYRAILGSNPDDKKHYGHNFLQIPLLKTH